MLTKQFDDVLPTFGYAHGNREAAMLKVYWWFAAALAALHRLACRRDIAPGAAGGCAFDAVEAAGIGKNGRACDLLAAWPRAE